MEGGAANRSDHERQKAAEARARKRAGLDPQTGDQELMQGAGEPVRAPDSVIQRATGRRPRPEGPPPADDVYARRRLLALGAVAIVVLILVFTVLGCGGGDEDREEPSEAPAQLLAEAATNPVSSGEATIDLDLDLEGDTPLAGGAGYEASGPFDSGDGTGIPAFELDGEGEAAGFGLDADVISTGEDAFVIFFGENYRVGEQRFAAAESAVADATGEGEGLVAGLTSFVEQPAYAGTEDVGGTATEKVEGSLDSVGAAQDLSALAESVGAPPFLSALAENAEPGTFAAWVTYPDDGGDPPTVRRIQIEFPFTVPPGQLAVTRGVESGTVALDAEVSDVGADVTIGVPAGGGFQPIDDLIGRIQSLASLGGL